MPPIRPAGKDRSALGTEAPTAPQAAAPTIRLAHVTGAQGDNNLIGRNGIERLPDTSRPALLIAFPYLEPFLKIQERYAYRDWVLDSGAFSAHNSGLEIKLEDYIETCKRLLQNDATLTEVFALDVIGDWRASVRNAELMWKAGVPAIPCFHYGEPWRVLLGLCKDYPKVAIGGCVGRRDKDKFAGQCFARVWPHRLHGFGFGSEKSILSLPWHSVDATNWEMGPCGFGRWASFGGAYINWRGGSQNLRSEVEYYLDLERRARERWAAEMKKLNEDPRYSQTPNSVRLVVGTGRSLRDHGIDAINGSGAADQSGGK